MSVVCPLTMADPSTPVWRSVRASTSIAVSITSTGVAPSSPNSRSPPSKMTTTSP